MTTLLLAEAPFRDLVSRAILEHLAASLPHAPPLLLATPAPRAPPGFAPVPPGSIPAGTRRVVLAGVFLDRAALESALALAAAAAQAGIELAVHDFGLEGEAGQAQAARGAEVLDAAGTLRLRDHRTANILTLWRVAAPMRILGYPERAIAPDPALAAALPPGRFLGIAMRGGEEMERAWKVRLPAIRRLLGPALDWPVLPLPSQVPGTPGSDWEGSRALALALAPGALLPLAELADPRAWRQQLRPARLKGLVARCGLVLGNRDLAAAYAVACGVPVMGVALGADRRIVSCLATLANELPPGSLLAHPPVGG